MLSLNRNETITQPTKRKTRRPTKYTEAIADRICERIVTGAILPGLGGKLFAGFNRFME